MKKKTMDMKQKRKGSGRSYEIHFPSSNRLIYGSVPIDTRYSSHEIREYLFLPF